MYFTQKNISMYLYDDVSIVLLPTAKDTRGKIAIWKSKFVFQSKKDFI